jgi:ribosomal protein S18 acetylase RimI-like enzyme
MDELQITLAGAERIDDVEPVYRALYEHHVAISTWRPAPPRGADEAWRRRRPRYEKTLGKPNGLLLVAEHDGRVVGALVGEVDDPADGSDVFAVPTSQAHVHDIAVLPEARGGGVGRALLERFEEVVRERGVQSYGLEVMAGNDSARRFYEAMGFVDVSFAMEKRLTGADEASARP